MNKIEQIKDRALELRRQSFVANVEAESLTLMVGQSRNYKLIDLESLQRIKTRFSRIRNFTGFDFRTELNGNTLTITRYEDEVVR